MYEKTEETIKHRTIGQQPGFFFSSDPGDKPLTNKFLTAFLVSAFWKFVLMERVRENRKEEGSSFGHQRTKKTFYSGDKMQMNVGTTVGFDPLLVYTENYSFVHQAQERR